MGIEVRWIDHGSADYEKMIDLRDEILRRPLGMSIDRSKLGAEADCHLLAAFDGAECVGTMVMSLDERGVARMRAVAVAESCQGQGIGRQMNSAFESKAKELQLVKIFLHARKVAIPFYVSLGYEAVGEEFDEVSIPHRAMHKSL